ncbi:MAG TPA: rhodanese-like domain-containing protein [Candidatus Angelobacter sp.]|nr:rhodanese-like domain-containing protein [Candidatus Angelobacter sp.]
MTASPSRSSAASLVISLLTFLLALAIVALPLSSIQGQERKPVDPWLSSETMQPAQLAKMLIDKYSSLPTVVFVGFRSLYVGGHVPDAAFHGTASTEQGLAELKSWAGALPRSTELVIYCGCCPFDKCPNIRPAYTALNGMGFKKIRVLLLPTSFAVDWADKHYPMQKGM